MFNTPSKCAFADFRLTFVNFLIILLLNKQNKKKSSIRALFKIMHKNLCRNHKIFQSQRVYIAKHLAT